MTLKNTQIIKHYRVGILGGRPAVICAEAAYLDGKREHRLWHGELSKPLPMWIALVAIV